MTKTKLAVGDRVYVSDPNWPDFWANGVNATISEPPRPVIALATGWSGHVRFVPTTTGVRPFYWLKLDEPRRDDDGDGPYHEAEIAESSLHSIPSDARAV